MYKSPKVNGKLVLNPVVTHWEKLGPRDRMAIEPEFEQPSASCVRS